MTIDVINCWPKNIYYPWFVWRMNKDRQRFNKVITVVTEGNNPDFDFSKQINIRDGMVLTPDILNLTAGGKDWRNVAVNVALGKSTADYVLFLEQDFLYTDDFSEWFLDPSASFGAVGFKDGNRFHPACLMVKRECIEKTSKDFSAYPPEGDHFWKFTKELQTQSIGIFLFGSDIPHCYGCWCHMSGLTFNYSLNDPKHEEGKFHAYNLLCDNLPQPDKWREFVRGKTKIDRADIDSVKHFFEGGGA